jgi:tetratricopeptide (TPR) repeat protein
LTTSAPVLRRSRLRPAWVGLIGLIIAVYAPALSGERVWDDHLLLEGNPVVRGDLPWWRAFAQPFQPFDAYYRPLTALALRGLLAFGGGATWPFHLLGLLLHLLTTSIVYRIARLARLGAWTALSAAALWGLHPALTEAVLWTSGLGDVLAACAMAGAALFWIQAWDRSGNALPAPGDRRVLAGLSALCFAAACLAKETAITLVLFLWWIVPLLWAPEEAPSRPGKWRRAVVLGLVPQLVVLALYGVLRASALDVSPNHLFTAAAGGPAGQAGSPGAMPNLGVRLLLLGKYALLVVAPLRLNLFHWIAAPRGPADPRIWLGLLALAAFVALCYLAARFRRRALLGGAWSLAALAPAILFTPPQTSLFSERYLYIPALGLALLLAGAAEGIVSRDRGRGIAQGPAAGRAVAVVVLALLAGSAFLTARRAVEWRREESLLATTLRREPRSPAIAVNLGLRLRQAGRTREAVELYKRTLDLVEEPPGGLLTDLDRTSLRRIAYEEGVLLADEGALEEAEGALRQALRYDPADERAIGTLGAVLGELRRYDEAKAVLEEGLRLHPDSSLLRQNLERCLEAMSGGPRSVGP